MISQRQQVDSTSSIHSEFLAFCWYIFLFAEHFNCTEHITDPRSPYLFSPTQEYTWNFYNE